jgi:tRNA pseudouridine13 synthase
LESAVQSAVFNRVFEMRLERGLFETALVGDIMKKHESGALFDVADAEAEQVRLDRLEISPTAALPGRKTRESAGIPLEIELAARREVGLDEKDLAKMDVGTRRSLRFPLDPNAEITALDETSYQLSISLPSGAYATVVLAELIKPESGQIIRTKPLET